ncbi:MAG: trypsin-like serine protease [Maritimibacter sp.]
MLPFIKRLTLALCLTFTALPALAEDSSPLRGLLTGDDSKGWEGVGRLDIGPHSFCTGALIAEDLVLTAGHCLFEKNGGRAYRADEIQFLAGWRNGRAEAYRGARQVVVHPDYLADMENRAVDLALIQLDRPIRNTTILPYETGNRGLLQRQVGVVSYALDREDRPSVQDLCHVLGEVKDALVLDCNVDFGSSGAPVFDLSSGKPRIISVVSAKAMAGDKKVSLGTDLVGPLSDMRALMAETDGVFTRARPLVQNGTGSGGSTGAKFVRP